MNIPKLFLQTKATHASHPFPSPKANKTLMRTKLFPKVFKSSGNVTDCQFA